MKLKPICILLSLGMAGQFGGVDASASTCENPPGLSAKILSDTIINEETLTISSLYPFPGPMTGMTFQQDSIVTQNGWQYMAYYTGNRKVAVARRKLPSDGWEIAEIKDYTIHSNDSHNTISLGVCPLDGTLHLSFDHHVSTLNYASSKPGILSNPENYEWDGELFGPVVSSLSGLRVNGVTYPRFVTTPEGHLLFIFRMGTSGDGDSVLFKYDGRQHKWEDLGMFVSRKGIYEGKEGTTHSRNAYFDRFIYDHTGRLHVTWVFREHYGSISNHDICYAYSDDDGLTWRNNDGELIARTGHEPVITVDSPGIVVIPISQRRSLSNTSAMTIDKQGRVHLVQSHLPISAPDSSQPFSEAMRYHHHWRDLNGEWHSNQLKYTGLRPELVVDSDSTLFLVFSFQNRFLIAYAGENDLWRNWGELDVPELSDQGISSEPQVDLARFNREKVLSILYVLKTKEYGNPTPLKVMDIRFASE